MISQVFSGYSYASLGPFGFVCIYVWSLTSFRLLGWERCACEHDGHPTHSHCNETNICQCRGEVRYGHGDTWSDPKLVDESIECSNEVFVTDLFFRQGKGCLCKQGATTTSTTTTTTTAISTTTTSEATWERCACEHDGHATHSDCSETNICQCRGEVRYGHGDTWTDPKQVDESIECSNEVFVIDPFPRQAKECQCKQGATTTSTTTTTTTATSTTTTREATWELCACEYDGYPTHSDGTETNICQCRGEVRHDHVAPHIAIALGQNA